MGCVDAHRRSPHGLGLEGGRPGKGLGRRGQLAAEKSAKGCAQGVTPACEFILRRDVRTGRDPLGRYGVQPADRACQRQQETARRTCRAVGVGLQVAQGQRAVGPGYRQVEQQHLACGQVASVVQYDAPAEPVRAVRFADQRALAVLTGKHSFADTQHEHVVVADRPGVQYIQHIHQRFAASTRARYGREGVPHVAGRGWRIGQTGEMVFKSREGSQVAGDQFRLAQLAGRAGQLQRSGDLCKPCRGGGAGGQVEQLTQHRLRLTVLIGGRLAGGRLIGLVGVAVAGDFVAGCQAFGGVLVGLSSGLDVAGADEHLGRGDRSPVELAQRRRAEVAVADHAQHIVPRKRRRQ